MLFAGQYSEDQDYSCDGTSNYRETNAAAGAARLKRGFPRYISG